MPIELSAARGLLFRITHIKNVPWLLRRGLWASGSALRDPNFVAIGNPDLISKRTTRHVPCPPGGTLSDYVPFYLTPRSPMLLNIKTGYKGITKRENDEIAILVSSFQRMVARGVTMLYTDRHAFVSTARFTADAADLATMIDWDILQRHDFARSDDYPDKMERYQAEALAHRHVPPNAIRAIVCASDNVCSAVQRMIQVSGATVQIVLRPGWFFP